MPDAMPFAARDGALAVTVRVTPRGGRDAIDRIGARSDRIGVGA